MTNFKYLVVLDGHGKGNVIKQLKTLDWNQILFENEFADEVLISINKLLVNDQNGTISDNFRDGSTCSIVKMFDLYRMLYYRRFTSRYQNK